MNLLFNEKEWEIYKERWSSSNYRASGGEPIRYPVIVHSYTYVEQYANYVKHSFGYEELLIAFRRAMKKNKV